MCLILFAYEAHPDYRLILAANRDEFYERPTRSLHVWQDHPDILAGRDSRGMGTWMGLSRDGRWAAITNYRDPKSIRASAPSRGNLVADYLKGTLSAEEYLQDTAPMSDAYNGFNLLVGDHDGIYYASNRGEWCRRLEPGVYGLSNHLLNTPWPKVSTGRDGLRNLLDQPGTSLKTELEKLLQDQSRPSDDRLPETGVGLAWERLLSPIYITGETYGTRCSSLLMITPEKKSYFKEITWEPSQPAPRAAGVRECVDFAAGCAKM